MAKPIIWVLLAIVAIGAIFVFVERAFSPTIQQCVATHQNNKQTSAADESAFSLKIAMKDYVRCSARLVKGLRVFYYRPCYHHNRRLHGHFVDSD
jgi:hypothetical protein